MDLLILKMKLLKAVFLTYPSLATYEAYKYCKDFSISQQRQFHKANSVPSTKLKGQNMNLLSSCFKESKAASDSIHLLKLTQTHLDITLNINVKNLKVEQGPGEKVQLVTGMKT